MMIDFEAPDGVVVIIDRDPSPQTVVCTTS